MDVRDRIPIRHCCTVESTVVATGAPVTRSLLRDHVEWGGPGTRRRSDNAQLEHVLEFPLCDTEAESSGTG